MYLTSLKSVTSAPSSSTLGSEQLRLPSYISIHPEPQSETIEQLFAKLRFENRDKLKELPIDLSFGGLG